MFRGIGFHKDNFTMIFLQNLMISAAFKNDNPIII